MCCAAPVYDGTLLDGTGMSKSCPFKVGSAYKSEPTVRGGYRTGLFVLLEALSSYNDGTRTYWLCRVLWEDGTVEEAYFDRMHWRVAK